MVFGRLVVGSLLLCASCSSDPAPTASATSASAPAASAQLSSSARATGSEQGPPAPASGSGLGLGTIGPGPGPQPTPTLLSRLRMGATSVAGKLPPEVIQRIVRHNFPKLKACYEPGLAQNATLEGRVVIQFRIQSDGSVKDVKPGGDLASEATMTCVSKVFESLSFPKPEAGEIRVSVPLAFAPSDKTLGGKALAEAKRPELDKALRDAGCSAPSASEVAGAEGVHLLSVEKSGKTFKITFVPASSAPGALAPAERERLAARAVAHGTFFLAVEGDDGVAAAALRDALLR